MIRGYVPGPDGQLVRIKAPAPEPVGFIDAEALAGLQPPTWLIEPYVAQGALIMLAATANTGKTFVAVDWALELSSEGHQVLYLALEGLPGMESRVAAWCSYHDRPAGGIQFGRPGYRVDLLDKRSVDQLCEEIERRGPFSLVVVDNLGEAFPGDENDARSVGTAMAALKRLQQASGGAVLDLHNFGHSAERARGHSKLLDAHDTVIYLKKEDGNTLRATCGKERNAERFDARGLKLQQHEDSLVVVPCTLVRGSEEITEALLSAGGSLTVTEIAESTGLERKTVQRRIRKLIELEEIREAGRRGNAQTYEPYFTEVI